MSSTQEVGEIFGAGSGPAHAMLRSPTVLIASVGLWGMNVYFFKVFGIDYVKVLSHDLLKLNEHVDSNNSQHSSNTCKRAKSRLLAGDKSENNKLAALDTSIDAPMAQDEETSIMESAPTTSSLDDLSNEISAGHLVCFSVTLLVLLHTTYSLWIDVLGGGTVGAIFAFYGAVTVAILFPLSSTRWLRHAATLVLQRAFELVHPRCHCLTNDSSSAGEEYKGPRPIPFVDVFFADAMCSLSKVFFDWGMLIHMMAHYPNAVPSSAWNILIPSAFAAVPYFIRARQCLVMWTVTSLKNDPGRYQHLWNALKYSTSIFPLCLSAYQKTVMQGRAHEIEIYLIILLVINAGYALWWDIVMDWGMMKNPVVAVSVVCNPVSSLASYSAVPSREHMHPSPGLARTNSGVVGGQTSSLSCWYALLRGRLRFGIWMSVLILVTDAVLRFSWVLRFYHKLFPSGDSFVLFTQFLEVFRRAIWNLLRVEWENLKQSGHHLAGQPKVSSPASVQMTPMTPSNMHGSDDESKGFLMQRGNLNVSNKITVEKNAMA